MYDFLRYVVFYFRTAWTYSQIKSISKLENFTCAPSSFDYNYIKAVYLLYDPETFIQFHSNSQPQVFGSKYFVKAT